jgi:hypothetical protein
MRLKTRIAIVALTVFLTAGLTGCVPRSKTLADREPGYREWNGVHFLSPGKKGLPLLKRVIDESLPPLGINVVILEVNYGFEYQSHPELRQSDGLSKEDIRELRALCSRHGIRLIPQFNCLGHQSWAENTFPLLTKYPQFDETPQIPLNNPGIYCRSWCPLHPEVNRVVFELMDELIDAFQPDAFHGGMDEVFLIASDQCPRCKGKDPAELYAKAINDYHRYLPGKKKLTMLMWGDRLLNAKKVGMSEWEASANGTDPAIDMIPQDIIICDWHYGLADRYRSIGVLIDKGFRVWPSSWKDLEPSLALVRDARRYQSPLMIGHLNTTWLSGPELYRAILQEGDPAEWGEMARQVAESLRACMKEINAPEK